MCQDLNQPQDYPHHCCRAEKGGMSVVHRCEGRPMTGNPQMYGHVMGRTTSGYDRQSHPGMGCRCSQEHRSPYERSAHPAESGPSEAIDHQVHQSWEYFTQPDPTGLGDATDRHSSSCRWCGGMHGARCPFVRTLWFHPNGTIAGVAFHRDPNLDQYFVETHDEAAITSETEATDDISGQ